MKRTKSEEQEGQEEEHIFYDVESSNGMNDSLQLKTKNPFSRPLLGHGSNIEILWPTGKKTKHTITMVNKTVSSLSLSFPCIDIIYNGVEIKCVRINSLEGIKARIINPVEPKFNSSVHYY